MKYLNGLPPGKRYGTIYTDFPWSYNDKGSRIAPDDPKTFKYATMTLAQIRECCAEIVEIAAAESHLWFWTTKDFRKYAEDFIKVAGFEFKTEFIWVKGRLEVVDPLGKNGLPIATLVKHIGMGHYNRLMHEYVLLGVRGNLKPFNGKSEPSVIIAPKQKHSKKPDVFYDIIERNSPTPRLELFARTHREGWDVWGDQIEGKQTEARTVVKDAEAFNFDF
jgi:N6-adenosine-specific RNA methylase IME4